MLLGESARKKLGVQKNIKNSQHWHHYYKQRCLLRIQKLQNPIKL